MKTIKIAILFILLNISVCFVFGYDTSPEGLQSEVLLHPADGFTAYTLKKNEFVYCQSPFTLPMPSWAWWGITDKITAEIDLLPLIGGFFQEPFLPVPSFNFRFKIVEQKSLRPAIAYETMFQYLWRTQNQSDQENLRIERQSGGSWYNHINFSWNTKNNLYFHFSTGLTYTQNLLIENKDSINYKGRFFSETINPDVSLSVDWRPKPWLSTHFTSSYGTTFVYLDNIPRKYQVSYGFRIAPFYKNKFGFLKTLRAEFIGFYMWMPDAQEEIESVVPIFPYLYWQWTSNN
ncbi:MAG: hypothetical protein PQJ61_09205 [Spirochaetales bacterium]|uniref:Uncharacterized protein n=1 Tax=Candidatus Thalassospirochaeta sargassi TaxID=3119039 RepID=A0AAJ1ICT3_9SPIO|nr:hypothetical protein [Spirochaetales bacterium]